MIDVINTSIEKVFDYNTRATQLKEVEKYILTTFNKENGYTSIPKEYYPFLYKLLTYKKYDFRGDYKEGSIRTFFVGKNEYNNNSIMFYDLSGKCDHIGCGSAINEWQKEKNAKWEHMKRSVLQVLRNIAKYETDKYKDGLKFPIKSEISDEIIQSKNDCHIDHYDKEFSQAAFDWLMLAKNNVERKSHKLIDIIYELYNIIDDERKYFKSKEWNRSWWRYHNNNTHLRAITNKENLSREKIYPNWELLKENGKYKMQSN